MGRIKPPPRVKLISGMLGGDPDLLDRAAQLMTRTLGPCDAVSQDWPFDQTAYYEEEFGPGLVRRFVSFETLIGPDQLAGIKRTTNEIEAQLAADTLQTGDGRCVNLDPGCLSLSKLVLATTKDHGHRIYLGQGIYGEVTLTYRDGGWQAWPWTFPDYAAGLYHAFFDDVRTRLKTKLDGRD